MAHYSYLPIDVGFDVRIHYMAVEGDAETLVTRMRAAGYRAKAAAAATEVEP